MDEEFTPTLNGYQVIQEVGHGGMATVYRARTPGGEDVAIKILLPIVAQDKKFRTRFAREITILRDLKHPNIVPILDHGQIDGRPYIVMPYSKHGTLQDELGNGALGPRRSARVVSGIAAALSHAHSRGIVHRDVKPSNILFDEHGDALLSDFGFAHLHDSTASLTGSLIIGTPAYMSPEQCQGDQIDARSDQYSLGIIIYQMSTGNLPYQAETPMGLIVKQINTPLPRPRYMNANVPDAIEDVLLRALEKDPADRYPSVDALNEDFQEAMLKSFDASTGRLRPEAISDKPITKVVEKKDVPKKADSSLGARLRRRAAPALLLLMIPLGALAAAGLVGNGEPAIDWSATVSALSTQNAERLGVEADDGQVSTAIAGTLAVMELAADVKATPAPTSPPESSETDEVLGLPVADATDTAVPEFVSTHTPVPPEPTEPPTTVEPEPTATEEPTATFTLPPTATNSATVTATPKPINPASCNPNPEHPRYCTPTPEA